MAGLDSAPYVSGPRQRFQRRATTSGAMLIILVGLLVAAIPSPAWATPSWSSVSSPNEGTRSNQLYGVSCVSATSCKAVGDFDNTRLGVNQTLIESWNGFAWTIQPSPNPSGAKFPGGGFKGISCVSPTSCEAVGFYSKSISVDQTLIESWNGSKWAIQSSPNGTGSDFLNGVSCLSATSCEAIGESGATSNTGQTLIESWNGSKWAIQSSPNKSTQNVLKGISCVSATSCEAVGLWVHTSGTGGNGTLIESWNGSKWTIQSSPGVGPTGLDPTELSGVSCVSATSCKAVGYATGQSSDEALVESWNGSKWTVQSTSFFGLSLEGISCVSATSCEAVGNTANASFHQLTFIESWNGSKWTVQSSPNPKMFLNDLPGVSCVSATSCKAVGDYFNSSGVGQTLIASYG